MRVVISLVAAAFAASLGLGSIAKAADFGAPPSGEYPILFNDHHVYAKPDVDKQNRVLAALVRGNTILVPLRSMFEQMGATVSYDPATRTASVSKPGSEVKVTVGKPEVVINGESRPLDVPPEIYQGTVLVPVRVISEGMGAYVQWVPEKKTVVVRYVPAAPAAPPLAPTATPKPVQTLAPIVPATFAPTPSPAPTYYNEKFIVGDVVYQPKIFNEFVPGNNGFSSWNVRAAMETSIIGMHLVLEADWRQFEWAHLATQTPTAGGAFVCPNPPGTAGCVTTLGGFTQAYAPAFSGRNNDIDVDVGMRFAWPRIYFIEGYMWAWNNYGYPKLSGTVVGVEKLPDLDHATSLYGRYTYALSIKGNYPSYQIGTTIYPGGKLIYRVQKYVLGYAWNFSRKLPLFLDMGYQGEGWINSSNAPSNVNNYGPYVGLGLHF